MLIILKQNNFNEWKENNNNLSNKLETISKISIEKEEIKQVTQETLLVGT